MTSAEDPGEDNVTVAAPSLNNTDGARVEASGDEPVSEPTAGLTGRLQGRLRVVADLGHPFVWGFAAALGVLLAVALGSAVSGLATVWVSIGLALFVALALDPLVRRLERRGASRGQGVAVVSAGFALVLLGLALLIVPAAISQLIRFAERAPGYVAAIAQAPWLAQLAAVAGGSAFVEPLLADLTAWLSDPARLLALGAGVLAVGVGFVSGATATLIVGVLTIYFLASLDRIKEALYSLAPAYSRRRVADLTEQITGAVGGFVSGMLTISGINAAFTLLLTIVVGVPYAPLLAFLALLITTIPMVGSVLFWFVVTGTTLLTNSWVAALVVGIAYSAFIQVEAYVVTPRIMNRVVAVPGSLVLIGAMVGAGLMGLLGALVAVPITASILLIVQQVIVPRQQAKTSPDDG